MLDQKHASLRKPPNDHNTYTLGAIGTHNVVITCLPKGKIATNSAATVAARMVNTFPAIKVGLMVGIGGGVPPKVRLGEVVVSTPVDQYPGVVQWDLGKTETDGHFRRTGALNNPPGVLLTALAALETQHEMEGSKIPDYLDELKLKWPRLATKYLRADSLEDLLFKADYNHVNESTTITEDSYDKSEGEENCQSCDKTKIVKRKPRDMRVHYGLIASGNQVIKDATLRGRLNKDLGGHVICIEMEAAGLMDNFPCIVIRGICDYADSHKNKNWQEHAAATAAAFAKELLNLLELNDVKEERTAKDILNQIHDTVSRTRADLAQIKSMMDSEKDLKILNWLTPIDYGPQQSDFLNRRHEETGTWLLHSNKFNMWLNQSNKTLFCPGIPGAGKTILASIVVDHLFSKFGADPIVGIACLYCNFQQQQQQRSEDLLLSILKPWLQKRAFMPANIKTLYESHIRQRTRLSRTETLEALNFVAALYSRTILIVDALDECDNSDGNRQNFLSTILTLQGKIGTNLFMTSRPNNDIAKYFDTSLSLKIRANTDDIKSYIDGQMSLQLDILDDSLRDRIRREVLRAVDGMFLLVQLHMNNLTGQPTKGDIKQALQDLSRGIEGLDKTYKQAMERINDQGSRIRSIAKPILAWIVHAKRLLSIIELRHALAVKLGSTELNEDYVPSARLTQYGGLLSDVGSGGPTSIF